MACVAQVEGADAADEEVADGKVEEAPEDIDCRRRHAQARWGGEGAVERNAGDSMDEMGDGVGEESAMRRVHGSNGS